MMTLTLTTIQKLFATIITTFVLEAQKLLHTIERRVRPFIRQHQNVLAAITAPILVIATIALTWYGWVGMRYIPFSQWVVMLMTGVYGLGFAAYFTSTITVTWLRKTMAVLQSFVFIGAMMIITETYGEANIEFAPIFIYIIVSLLGVIGAFDDPSKSEDFTHQRDGY